MSLRLIAPVLRRLRLSVSLLLAAAALVFALQTNPTVNAMPAMAHAAMAHPAQGGAAAVNAAAGVTIADYSFTPQVITITAGSSVVWTNNGPSNHTTTSDDGLSWDSHDLKPGSTFPMTFTVPGTYNYHCAIHPTLMTGSVIVVGTAVFLPLIMRS